MNCYFKISREKIGFFFKAWIRKKYKKFVLSIRDSSLGARNLQVSHQRLNFYHTISINMVNQIHSVVVVLQIF